MNLENLAPSQKDENGILEKLSINTQPLENLYSMNEPLENPYTSGFDKKHPMPTYDQLRNAGFSDYLANQILYGTHSYSDKELFNVLYSSNPVEAYNKMMEEKVEVTLKKSDDLINSIHKEFGI